jgi:molybdopterin-containing oxidoreductase family membrane subunit
MVGAAGVIVAMYALYRYQGLNKYITAKHFDNMGKLLVLLSAVYVYFNINEYFVPFYKMKGHEAEHLNSLMYGDYAPMFWSVQILGMVLPMILLMFKWGRKPGVLSLISVVVIVGAWFKRYLIVVPTLSHPYIPTDRVPESWIHYNPTFPEWTITAATLAAALMIITLLVRYFPVIPVQETLEEMELDSSPEDNLSYDG